MNEDLDKLLAELGFNGVFLLPAEVRFVLRCSETHEADLRKRRAVASYRNGKRVLVECGSLAKHILKHTVRAHGENDAEMLGRLLAVAERLRGERLTAENRKAA